MKRTVLIAAGIAAMMLMTSCSQAVKSQSETAKTTAGTAETTSASLPEETTASASTSEEPATPKVEVTDAVNRTVESMGEKFDFKIPKVTISGVSTDAANETIRSETEKKYYEGDNKDNYDSRYQFFVNAKTVSILLLNMDLTGGDYQYTKAYTIDLKTGKILTDSEVVQLCGMTDDDFFKMVRSKYEEFNKTHFSEDLSKEARADMEENFTFITYEHIDTYMDKEGRLCFVGYLNWEGGAGNGYYCFDHEK